jgi:hypothetical protein
LYAIAQFAWDNSTEAGRGHGVEITDKKADKQPLIKGHFKYLTMASWRAAELFLNVGTLKVLVKLVKIFDKVKV